jgi:predicted MPP superfamily phosphohydrolase
MVMTFIRKLPYVAPLSMFLCVASIPFACLQDWPNNLTAVRLAYVVGVLLGAGFALEGCDFWGKRLLVAVAGGAAGAFVASRTGHPSLVTLPAFCALIGANVTARTILSRPAPRTLLGVASLAVPPFLVLSCDVGELTPLMVGLFAGFLVEALCRVCRVLRRTDTTNRSTLSPGSTAPADDLHLVHISDLHECWYEERGGWASVRDLVRATRPSLLLITGDLVETPSPRAFREAKRRIDLLDVPAIVLPGNHDVLSCGTFFRAPGARRLFRTLFPFTDAASTSRMQLITLDSNSNPWLATARVSSADLDQVPRRFASADVSPAALRVVALHHHAVPLPFATDTGLLNQDVLLTLRNSSSFLARMEEADVDLVLHGHRHMAALLRLTNYGYSDFRDAPLTILSAGSATLRQDGGANLNVVTVRPNCTAVITRHFYPPGRERPAIEPQVPVCTYQDQKRRLFRRYAFALGVQIELVTVQVDVNRFGSAKMSIQMHAIEFAADREPEISFSIASKLGRHGKVSCCWRRTDAPQADWQPLAPSKVAEGPFPRFQARFPSEVQSGARVDMTLTYPMHFAFARTQAEARRLGSPDVEHEFVAYAIRYPMRKLQLRLRREHVLSIAPPMLEVQFNPAILAAAIPRDGIPNVPFSEPGAVWIADEDAKREESGGRRLGLAWDSIAADAPTAPADSEHTWWELETERPMIGYRYVLRWRLADAQPNETLSATRASSDETCRSLLRFAAPQDQIGPALTAVATSFLKQFNPGCEETVALAIYVPDPDDACKLTCVGEVHHRRHSAGPVAALAASKPMGKDPLQASEGIVGAAFKLARGVRYVEGVADEGYFREMEGGLDFKVALAIPFFHPDAEVSGQTQIAQSPLAILDTCARATHRIAQGDLRSAVGPAMVAFIGSTSAASYLRYCLCEPQTIPLAAAADETSRRHEVMPWLMKRLETLFVAFADEARKQLTVD